MKQRISRSFLGAAFLALSGLAVTASAAPTLNLPSGSYTPTVTFDASFGLGAYFNVVFGTPPIPAGFDVVQGFKYLGWCAEFADDIGSVGATGQSTLTPGPYKLYNSLGSLPTDAQSPNWGAVNWLLNNKGGNGVVDIQEAIWFLLNGAYHLNFFITSAPSAATSALVTAALMHNSFVPGPGQVVAVLLDGGDGLKNDGTDTQSLIIEVTVPTPGTLSAATIGFWHNKNGQAVIESFNGGSSAKGLGNWLATNFPNLFGTACAYGSSPSCNLAGDTNAQVAAFYGNLWTPSGLQKNTYVQVLAVALGCYASSTTLAGTDPTATKFGFVQTPGGTCSVGFNVGSDGAAFGVPNNTVVLISQLLQTANANFNPVTGVFFGGSSTLTSDLNDIFNAINSMGGV